MTISAVQLLPLSASSLLVRWVQSNLAVHQWEIGVSEAGKNAWRSVGSPTGTWFLTTGFGILGLTEGKLYDARVRGVGVGDTWHLTTIPLAPGSALPIPIPPVTPPPPPPSPDLLWAADFSSAALNNGDHGVPTGWPSGTTIEECAGGRIKSYPHTLKPAGAPDPLTGTHACAFTVLDTDVKPCTPTVNPRASAFKHAILKPGMEPWEHFAVWFGSLPNSPWFFLFQEDYGEPFNSDPPIAFYLQNFDGKGNRLYITGNYNPSTKRTEHIWEGPLVPTDRWVTFMPHRRLATDKSGWFECWIDGKPITFKNGQTRMGGQQTMLTGATTANTGFMHYRKDARAGGIKGPVTIVLDHFRLGRTREAVEQGLVAA